MKYKGQYRPSDLLDPETYEWYPFDQCSALLDKYRYVSFANPPTANSEEYDNDDDVNEPPPGMLDPEKVSDDDVKIVNVFYNGLYRHFDDIPDLKNNENIKYKLKKYYAAVGKELAEKMGYDCGL